jgi:hypothetical protein
MAGTAEEVKGKAQDVAGQVQDKARSTLRDQVDRRSTQAGEGVSAQADDLRTVGEQLREQGKDGPAKIADQAAQRVERVGSWLTNSDVDTILQDIEDAGRRNPWAVLAGGLAAGLVASRFLKASSADRYERRIADGWTPPSRQLPARAGESRFSRPQGGMGTRPAAGPGAGVGTGAPPTGMSATSAMPPSVDAGPA